MELKTFTVILAFALVVAILKMLIDALRIAILKEDIEGYKTRINVLNNVNKMFKHVNTQKLHERSTQVRCFKFIPETYVETPCETYKDKNGGERFSSIAIVNNQIKYLAYKGDL